MQVKTAVTVLYTGPQNLLEETDSGKLDVAGCHCGRCFSGKVDSFILQARLFEVNFEQSYRPVGFHRYS